MYYKYATIVGLFSLTCIEESIKSSLSYISKYLLKCQLCFSFVQLTVTGPPGDPMGRVQ